MVCWLFVGSALFSSVFALLGGQAYIEKMVLGLGLSSLGFMILAQAIIFLLDWPLEWTEIIIIFIPIFVPLLDDFGVNPLFFGVMVALNLQTSFLSPPVAMAPFYIQGRRAPAGDHQRDIQGNDALHLDRRPVHGPDARLPRNGPLATAIHVRLRAPAN